MKEVPRFPGYFASRDGRVRSTRQRKDGRWLKPIPHASGYLILRLMQSRVARWRKLHQVICETFHGPKPVGKTQVRHVDGNQLNNRASNLRWGTSLEDAADRRRHGTLTQGERCHSARLTEAEVLMIREQLDAGDRVCDVCRETGMSRGAISKIRDRRSWRHLKEER